MLQPPSAASREFGSPPPRSSRRRRQRRQLLQAAAAVGLGLLLVGAYAWRQAARPVDTDPTRRVATRVLKLDQALERYGTRQGRQPGEQSYPSTGQFVAFVRSLPDGAELLANPYGDPPQAGPVAPADGLPTAAQFRDRDTKLLPNTILGPGAAPGATYTARTYGALVYDHDPKTDSYVLYGIAQAGDQAIVAAKADSGL